MLRLLRTQLVTPKGLDGDLAGRENRAPLDRGRLRADATETMRENIQYTGAWLSAAPDRGQGIANPAAAPP